MSIQCNCEYCQVDGNPCPLAEAQAALAASQAEGEFYASEAEALRVEVGHLKDSHASRDAELESAESALAASQAENERLREQMNTKYWDKVRKDNTSLKRRASAAEAALAEARGRIAELQEEKEWAETQVSEAAQGYFRGNSVQHWMNKAKAYGDTVFAVCNAFRSLGYKGDFQDTTTLPNRLQEFADSQLASRDHWRSIAERVGEELEDGIDDLDRYKSSNCVNYYIEGYAALLRARALLATAPEGGEEGTVPCEKHGTPCPTESCVHHERRSRDE